MTPETYSDQTIRDYLLGQLPESESERLDELTITDDECAERVRAVEHDLVDAFARGELTGVVLEQFRSSYLTTPQLAVGTWWYDARRTESALLAQPVYRVLKKNDRVIYDKLLAEYRVYRRDEVSHERFVNLANSEIARAATESLARASQDSVLALVKDMVDTAKRLQSAPGDACYRFWFPNVDGPPDIAASVDAKSQAHTLDLMAEVIRSAAEQPSPPPDTEAVKDILATVVNATYDQYGTDAQMLANAADPRADRTKVCAITISVYERILQLPPAQAGELLRAMAPTN